MDITKLKNEDINVYLKFLELTKDGKYAEIEHSSIPYARLEIQAEPIYDEEDLGYYSIR